MKISGIEVKLIHHVGDDLDVANAARVSFDKESEWEYNRADEYPDFLHLLNNGWEDITESDFYDFLVRRLKEGDKKLINYLAKHKHHSPFNHSFLSFRVKAPIFCARQLQKHKFMPWNEVSRRYVDSEPEFYFPEYWRKRADNVKQGSSEGICEEAYKAEDEWDMSAHGYSQYIIEASLAAYNFLLSKGVCAEQARMVLPQNTMTEWRWSGTLGAFLDMLVLRLDPHTQKETRIVAEQIAAVVKELFPVSYAAYIGE